MGEREKIAAEIDLKKAALHKKVRAANRWNFAQRLVDLSFALLFTACVLIGYYGYVAIAVALLLLTLFLAWLRWRHWNDRNLPSGHADIWDLQDPPSTDWGNDLSDSSSSDSSDSGGDASGGD